MDPTAVNPYPLESVAPFLLTVLILVLLTAFVMWLSVFLLNFLIDTSRSGARERSWSTAHQLTFGFTLLCLVAMLSIIQATVFYKPYEPSRLIPPHAQTQ